MSEDATLDKFVDSNESKEVEQPELIQGVAWSTIEFLPDDWTVDDLESKINILSGKNFSSDYFVEEGGIPLIRIRDLAENETTVNFEGDYDSKYLINQQDLLVGMDGEFEPHLWSGPQALLNQRVCKIEPEGGYNKIFFRYAIEKPLFYIQKSIAGTTVKHLSQSNIKDLNLPTPPLPEQRKIATVLYTVDRAIEKTKKILDQSQQIKKGVVQNLMTKGAHQHTSYEDYRLGPIDLTKPKEWDLRSFGEFSFRIQDGPHITPDYVDEGIPFVSSQNVNPFGEEFDYSQYEKYISEGTYEDINQNCRPEKGDLIISRRATIGPTQLIRHNGQFGFFVGVAVIKTDDTVYNPFLEQLMNWSVMNKLWHLKSPGSTMKTLNLGTIKDQKVPLPSIQEQKEIVEIIGSIDEVIANNQRYKESLQYLKRGLQQDLLSGTVRTTDTNIEVPDEIVQHG